MRGLENKVIVCAGSATGIGAATIRRLAAAGSKIVLGDVNLASAQALIDEVAPGGQGIAVEFDIVEPDSVENLIKTAVSEYGGLDGMHVNATDRRVNQLDTNILANDMDVFDRIHAVSLRGHVLCTRFGLPEILKRGGGSIVYTSSGAAITPSSFNACYSIAKSGLNGLMRHVAYEWGLQGVRANAVLPGPVVTEYMEVHTTEETREHMKSRLRSPRLGKMDDVAAAVEFLLSDEAEWINGQMINVNGGAWIVP